MNTKCTRMLKLWIYDLMKYIFIDKSNEKDGKNSALKTQTEPIFIASIMLYTVSCCND